MTILNKCVIVGASGHAKVVLDAALTNGYDVIGFLDDNESVQGELHCGLPIIGKISELSTRKYSHAVIAIGNNQIRSIIAKKYQSDTHWVTCIHTKAYVHPSAQIGQGTVVFAGAIIQPDVIIGNHCIINTATSIDHDCIINDYCHLAPGVHLAGNVKVGQGVFMGIGSVAIPGVNIGHNATIGAGGVVIESIPSEKTVMGVPAKERCK